MTDDPIVAEVRMIRDRLAARFDYDLDAIYDDIKRQEKASARKLVRYAPRPCRRDGVELHAPASLADGPTP